MPESLKSVPWYQTAAAIGLSKKASRGKKRSRVAMEEVGCIRAAAYQGEAFLQARLEVLHQQGAVAGNSTLPDADTQVTSAFD